MPTPVYFIFFRVFLTKLSLGLIPWFTFGFEFSVCIGGHRTEPDLLLFLQIFVFVVFIFILINDIVWYGSLSLLVKREKSNVCLFVEI